MTQAQGSGFFISADGYIVTNDHVVDHATEVTVTTSDGKSMPAKVIGVDSKTDLALLKAQGSDFPYVNFASQAPRVGDWVIAVGNPFGLGGTVTAGIVSARGRDIGSGPYDDFLQIDAPVNHGNSGGPTFNAEGEVVGVNTAIFSPSGGSVGIGFAIASDVVKNVVQQLKENGSVTRGWIGVQIQSVTPDLADNLGLKNAAGALVAEAQKDSPAAAAGVKSGDVITAVDGEAVADPHDLARRIAALGPKKTAKLSIVRDGSPMTIDVTLGTMPADKMASAETRGSDSNEGSALAKLGLTLRAAHGQDGVVIADVDPDGAAADKGLKEGDVILEVAGKPVNRPSEVAEAINAAKSDGKKSVLIRVKSGDGERYPYAAHARVLILGVPRPHVGRRHEMGGRVHGHVPGPAHSAPFRPSRRSHISPPARPRQGGGRSLSSPPRTCRHSFFGLSAADSLYVRHAHPHHRRRPRRGGLPRQGVPGSRTRRGPGQ